MEWIKANWDAVVDRDKGSMGLGIILWDHIGAFMAAKGVTKLGFLEPADAKV